MAILEEGKNCWRISPARRAAFLIDGEAYFKFLAQAIEAAQRTICIAGWDIDSRVELTRGEGSENGRNDLGDFLNAKAERTPELQVYVLSWDFPMLYIRERELLPLFNLGWKTHRRVHFHLDDEHPFGASQHQKFVVIDGCLAFCGGFDLTNNRWDTSGHDPEDPRRTDPDDDAYGPFHDMQMMVDGEAAAALQDLFVDRWCRATGERLRLNRDPSGDPLPENLSPDVKDVEVAVARTLPAFKEREEVKEIEKLYRDAVAAAENSIYIENQYLTSFRIASWLEDSLSLETGPEIVIVLPEKSSGWLEQSTMDALRARYLQKLSDADQNGRLRVFHPVCKDGKSPVYVHSKVMVVDDRLAVVGSANLSNRSMGFDSECNLAVEAGNTETADAIAALRNRLLAEHLGVAADEFSDILHEKDSMIAAIETLSGSKGRRLKKLPFHQDLPIDAVDIVEDEDLLDPESPIGFDRMMDRFVVDENGRAKIREIVKIAAVLLVLLALAAAWRWTPLSDWIDREKLTIWAEAVRGTPVSFIVVPAAYAVGGLLMAPITLLIGVTAMVFSPPWGTLYALGGCVSNALVTYLLGAVLGRRWVRKLAGRRLNRLSRQMAKQGILAVAVIRNIPVAHFGIVNMVAGASHIRLRDFLLGTALGMLPGIVAITVFTDRLLEAFRKPNWINMGILAALALVILLASWWAKKRLSADSTGGEEK